MLRSGAVSGGADADADADAEADASVRSSEWLDLRLFCTNQVSNECLWNNNFSVLHKSRFDQTRRLCWLAYLVGDV